jgi:YHS domain-containing protein
MTKTLGGNTKMENMASQANMAKDPVCGMDVDPAQAAGQSEYKGQTYYFCSSGCKKQFDKDPEQYVGHTDRQGAQQ